MPYETILFDISDRVACITLNRPEKLNAFTARMHEELHEALKQVYAGDAVRALLITGNGRGFCAGQDLNERAMSETVRPRSNWAAHLRRATTLWCAGCGS